MEKTNMIEQIRFQLIQSNKRFTRLETNTLESENYLEEKKIEKENHKTKIEKKLNENKIELKTIEKEVFEISKNLNNLSMRFKELVKQDTFNSTEAKINRWDLEKFITKKEFEKLLENIQ